MRRGGVSPFFAAVSLLFVYACATPQEVRELADQTAAKTTLIAKDAKTLASQRRNLAESRTQSIARIQQLANANQAYIAEQVAVYEVAGFKAEPDLFKNLETLVAAIEEIDNSSVDTAAIREELLRANTRISIDAASATKAGKALAQLAAEEPVGSNLAFFAGFSRDVYDDVASRIDEAKKAADKGEALANDTVDALEADAEAMPENLTSPEPQS